MLAMAMAPPITSRGRRAPTSESVPVTAEPPLRIDRHGAWLSRVVLMMEVDDDAVDWKSYWATPAFHTVR